MHCGQEPAPLPCNTIFFQREILSQMKNSQPTAKDTQPPDTLTKLPDQNRTEQTETKDWDLHSLWPETLVASPPLVDRHLRVIAGGDWASATSSRKCGFHGATHIQQPGNELWSIHCAVPHKKRDWTSCQFSTHITTYEPNVELTNTNFDKHQSAHGDSAQNSSDTVSSSTFTETDGIPTTILVSESSHHAQRNRLRSQARNRRSSLEEERLNSKRDATRTR